jgi:hypothetical protein
MMSAIDNTVTSGITLATSGTYASPLTITSMGYVDNTGTGDAIYGPNTQAWTVVNYGRVASTGTAGRYGVSLGDGGAVSNSGTIIALQAGIFVGSAPGTITNSGTISGSNYGVKLTAGGVVTNQSGGRIVATNTMGVHVVPTSGIGIYIVNALGTVSNAGYITGNVAGIELGAGGSVTNQGGGTINGGIFGISVLLNDGGTVVNQAGGTITDGIGIAGTIGSVTNAGSIKGGVTLNAGGMAVNQANGTIYGISGVDLHGATSTLTNYGSVSGSPGAFLRYGAAIFNQQSANIIGSEAGIFIFKTGYVSNAGNIASPERRLQFDAGGISLLGGGTIVNQAGGTIAAATYGVASYRGDYAIGTVTITNAAVTLTNAGTITGGYSGVSLLAGGMVINQAGGTIGGVSRGGVYMVGGNSTIINAGTIRAGTSSAAVVFGGSYTNRLVLEPGASFVGGIFGGSGSDTLELAGSAGNPLTVNYNGLHLVRFEDVMFGSDGYAALSVTNASGTLPLTVSGFGLPTDLIDLTAIGTNGTISGQSSPQVTVSGSSGTVTLQLDVSDSISFITSSDGVSGTNLVPVCFCRGTMILTEYGEVAAESLAVGDRVVTLSGATKPIVWIGMGRDLVTGRHSLARPIIVRRGALADDVPRRDLYLTHGHALYLDGVLIPVENLINHRSILWDDAARVVEYYHLELEDHDVVLAEGAAAETYYDAANRALFQIRRPDSQAGAAKPTFAPVLTGGERVDAVWAALFARCGGRIETATTEDADLHLVIKGKRTEAVSIKGCAYTFALDGSPLGSLRLASRSAVPSLLGLIRHDHRRLGVAISAIELRQAGVATIVRHDGTLFRDGGCHPPEAGHSWTDGVFDLPARLFAHLDGPSELTIRTEQPGMRYPISATRARAA